MSLFRGAIEKKLSAMLGAPVTVDGMKLSPLAGTLEATGARVAGRAGEPPLLTVRRVYAQISIAKAFSRQIAIKSLTVEGPVLTILRRVDGSTNLPGGIGAINRAKPALEATTTAARDEANASIAGPPQAPPAPSEKSRSEKSHPSSSDDDGGTWTMEAQRVIVSDAQVRYRDESAGPAYEAAAEQVQVEVRQKPGEIAFVLLAVAAGRRDVSAEVGPIHARGTFTNVQSMQKLASAALTATVELSGGRGVVISATTPRLESGDVSLSGRGPVELPLVRAILPAGVLPPALRSHRFAGVLTIDIQALVSRADGVVLKQFSIKGNDVTIPVNLERVG